MNNVIAFPKAKKDSPPQSLEELFEHIEETRRGQIEFIVEDFLPQFFHAMWYEGFDLTTDDCEKYTTLFVESLKGALYKSVKLDHPMHEVAENLWDNQEEPTESI